MHRPPDLACYGIDPDDDPNPLRCPGCGERLPNAPASVERTKRLAYVGYRDVYGADGEPTGEVIVDREEWEDVEVVTWQCPSCGTCHSEEYP